MNRQNKDDRWVFAVRATFILVILFVAVFSGCHSGIFETTYPSTTPIATMPSETTTQTSTTQATQQTTETTTAETTQPTETTTAETTTESTADSVSTEETTYPPVTFPTGSSYTPVVEPTDITFDDITDAAMAELIEEKFLTVRDSSRSGEKLWELKNVVVHYVANPGTSALKNWSYFETQTETAVSAHFIIGLEGEIIQCMPLDEVAWAVGVKEGNYTSVSIECCHPDETGKFTDETYESLIKLVSWLCNKFELGRDDVLRHYDYGRQVSWGVWHKECPLYFADADDPASHLRWADFKEALLIKE